MAEDIKLRKVALLIVSLITLPVAAMISIPTVQAKNPTGKIAFTVCQDVCETGGRIYSINADGSNLTLLTGERVASHPTWSPDGRKIAFSVFYNGQDDFRAQIYVINADGTNPTALTSRDQSAWFPTWSPTGEYIVYFNISYRDSRVDNVELFRMNADGTSQRSFGLPFASLGASFSPDGNRVALAIKQDKAVNLLNVDVEGTNTLTLTSNTFENFAPSWSPNGKQLVFESRQNNSGQIYKLNADGSNLTNLSNSTTDDGAPLWSPDGRYIAFVRDNGLWIMYQDGSTPMQITDRDFGAVAPGGYGWSPDGQWLAFSAKTWDSPSEYGLFRVDVNCVTTSSGCTNSPVALTNNQFEARIDIARPVWSPEVRQNQ